MKSGTVGPLSAPAKVNLYLHVIGRRSDGYHRIDSLFAFADIGDVISVAAADHWSFSVDGPFAAAVPANEDNLVMRAGRALAQAVGNPGAVAIRLTKNLPVAAGLGGGSADAAAAMRGLATLWGLAIDETQLCRLALTLGADLPACLAARPVFVGGIGEEMAPAPPLPPAWLLLVNPGAELPTAAVYRRRAGSFSAAAWFSEAPATAGDLAALLAERRNDLTAPAIALAPIVASVLERLAALPGALLTRMSGSGATCFALFADANTAEKGATILRTETPAWWVRVARLLP